MLAQVRRALRAFSRAAWIRGIRDRKNELQLATCLLLLEVAFADGGLTEPERDCMESVLSEQFGLSGGRVKQLIGAARTTRTKSVDLHALTARVAARLSAAQKVVLLRVLHDVAHSDGYVTQKENYLLRRVSCLLRIDAGSV